MIHLKNEVHYRGISPFSMQLSYVNIRRDDPENQYDSHVHPECEIYVNLSGDVSFMVEDRIYPILPGSVIITHPYEYHHCIYHSNEPHKHLWILVSSEGNESLLSRFFERTGGEGNHLFLRDDRLKEFCELSLELIEKDLSDTERYYRFFCILRLLFEAESPKGEDVGEMQTILSYIDAHISEPLTVSELAEAAHVSINTLGRHFMKHLGMSPSTYLRKKRLAVAAKRLYEGASVTDACRDSGFSDDSHFISLFRRYYGVTPNRYKKNITS